MSAHADGTQERRAEARLDRVHKLFLQVVSEDPGDGRLLRCTCENVSAQGIGVTLLEPLRVGTRVDLWVNVEGESSSFLLGGEVRWCRPSAHKSLHEVGVALGGCEPEELGRWAGLWEAVPA